MAPAIAIVLIIAVLVIVPRVLGASLAELLSSIFAGGVNSHSKFKRNHRAFTTTVAPAGVPAAVLDAATVMNAIAAPDVSMASRTKVTFPGGAGGVNVTTTLDATGTKVGVAPWGSPGDEALARFHGVMLAKLRERDPRASQR
ncbi:MAG TPA: hypothetical protein VGN51_22330 [Acidimicrobiia bacterium]|jgi:hypothetical protein